VLETQDDRAMTDPADAARLAGLKLLARRELSEAQLRRRLKARGHAADAISGAVDALKAAGSLDDARAAGAIVRLEAGIRRRGRGRVEQRLAAAGIARAVAEQAIADAFETIDADAQLRAALDRRLGPDRPITGDREFGRLYRHLVGQGHDGERVLRLLRARQARE
jgi:regulatory protein